MSTKIISFTVSIFIFSSVHINAVLGSPKKNYSPFVERNYPTAVLWGDTHLHSTLSHDAFHNGNRLTPDDAYRFAKGEPVISSSGQEVRLRRPLDFLMVSDHAENLGVLPQLAIGGGSLPKTEAREYWSKRVAELPPVSEILRVRSLENFLQRRRLLSAASGARHADYALTKEFQQSIWGEVIANAERHNDPGTFTTFIGFEWSATVPVAGAKSRMNHRNILFRGGKKVTSQVLPYSRFHSSDPQDLWKYLKDYEEKTEGQVLAIPHNSNLSGGFTFQAKTLKGEVFTQDYATERSRWEPIVEITQRKGDGETHPLVSPTDEFADYETHIWSKKGEATLEEAKSYARPALKEGLNQYAKLGINPFKFGVIGSTDAHNSLSTAREDNYWGSTALGEASPYRTRIKGMDRAASGYAAVWATANTRAAIFDAFLRREVYASTGPRITVRFFGGWNYVSEDLFHPNLAQIGYSKGVPMGGDLSLAPGGLSPSFLIQAVKEADGANLDRVQVIKGWRDSNGQLHEKIYNVALSDGRSETADGEVPKLLSTVDVKNASYSNSVGAPKLSVVWTDPNFKKDEPSFYYLRVLEIPTPRWTAYDATYYRLTELPDETEMITQERAYTSPIWYTP